jgi:16S rRNA (guanine966-N2)-methyltransferase
MNILAGRFKGKKIRTIAKASYRPTTSRVRKSIFDMLGDLDGCSVLDLFAGSGILGFEAASRGAAAVAFVDNDRRNVQLIHVNSQILQDQVDIKVVHKEWIRYLRVRHEYDIIFADPPYGKIDTTKLVEKCLTTLLINGRFVLETSSRESVPVGGRSKRFGDTMITIWTKTV